MSYIKGTEITVESVFTVISTDQYPAATTRMRDAAGYEHYLYLPAFGYDRAGPSAVKAGQKIGLRFSATVRGDDEATPAGTTPVRNTTGFYHYVNLDSPAARAVGAVGAPSPEIPAEKEKGKEMAYKQGDEIIVTSTFTVISKAKQASGTTLVRDATGYAHSLFLPSFGYTVSGVREGQEIPLNFAAKVSWKVDGDPVNLTRIRDTSFGGFYHFIAAGSAAVRLADTAGKPAGKKPEPAYKAGDEIFIESVFTVEGPRGAQIGGTTAVRDQSGFRHFLYLPGVARTDGETFPADFTATVLDGAPGDTGFLTRVRSKIRQFVSYVNLESPAVRGAAASQPEPAAVKEKETAAAPPYKAGGKIRIESVFTVKDTPGTAPNTTTRVTDKLGFTHLLYLPGLGITAGAVGSSSTYAFTASILDGEVNAAGRTTVRSESPGTGNTYTHYLNLRSPAVSFLDTGSRPESAAKAADPAAAAAAPITPSDEVIRSTRVRDRIKALDAEQKNCKVSRTRNGEELGRFSSREDAARFIDEQDFNPDRVQIAVDETFAPGELTQLREFSKQASAAIIGWGGDVTVLSERVLDATWARVQFRNKLKLAPNVSLTKVWPWIGFDWDKAAAQLRDELPAVSYGGRKFYLTTR